MSTIQKKVIDLFRKYPELLKECKSDSLHEKRLHLHNKFLFFMDKLDIQLDYKNKNYKEIIELYQIIHIFDIELVIKMGIQFSLWGESVYRLGTEKHLPFVDKTASLDIYGSFAMTEIGHGSNIMKLETTATYNQSNCSFTIHSPYRSSHKYWIGQSGMFAHYAIVFAQLLIIEKNKIKQKGVHPFIVPLRNSNNEICEGITITDCGVKNGLNSIDNGEICFNQVVIPYDNLLNRYAYIDLSGVYHSVKGRFSKMLQELTNNRIGLGLGSNMVARYALQQTLKYTNKRKQFGSHNEQTILRYTSMQHRLLPLYAKSYVYMLFNEYATSQLNSFNTPGNKHFNSIISKTNCTWNALRTLQECREACGGHGYHYLTRFGKMYRNLDIFTTFEGDNNVLLQQLVQIMLKERKQTFNTSQILKYKLFKYINVLNYLFPNIIGNSNYKFNLKLFHKYIQHRIDYKLSALLLYFNQKIKEEMNPFEMWTSKSTHIDEISKLISFNNILDISLFSLNDINRPIIEIFVLQHIKKNGIFYIVDNNISVELINNINSLLEKNMQ